MIAFACPCGEPLAAAPEHAGLKVRCPKCQAVLTVPRAESEFEYADDAAPPPPPRRAVPLPPPPRNKPVLVEEREKKPRPADDDDEPRRRKKKPRRRRESDDDQPDHVRRLMDKANADLDEEEERHRREGGGIHFTPGIISGIIAVLVGSVLFILVLCTFPNLWLLAGAGSLALGGLVRAVLAFLGKGVD